MEAIEKCLSFSGNFDGRGKMKNIFFKRKREREKKTV